MENAPANVEPTASVPPNVLEEPAVASELVTLKDVPHLIHVWRGVRPLTALELKEIEFFDGFKLIDWFHARGDTAFAMVLKTQESIISGVFHKVWFNLETIWEDLEDSDGRINYEPICEVCQKDAPVGCFFEGNESLNEWVCPLCQEMREAFKENKTAKRKNMDDDASSGDKEAKPTPTKTVKRLYLR